MGAYGKPGFWGGERMGGGGEECMKILGMNAKSRVKLTYRMKC